MVIRNVNIENDYDELSGWWRSQEWPVIPPEMMSPSGFIAEDGDTKIAATWAFSTNCPIFIMEWTVGNPEVDHKIRAEGLELVTEAACKWAKDNGAKHILTMTSHNRFIGKLEEFGFKKTDSDVTHLMRSL